MTYAFKLDNSDTETSCGAAIYEDKCLQDYPTKAASYESKGKASPPGPKKYETSGGLGVVSLCEEKLPWTGKVLHSEKGQTEDKKKTILRRN